MRRLPKGGGKGGKKRGTRGSVDRREPAEKGAQGAPRRNPDGEQAGIRNLQLDTRQQVGRGSPKAAGGRRLVAAATKAEEAGRAGHSRQAGITDRVDTVTGTRVPGEGGEAVKAKGARVGEGARWHGRGAAGAGYRKKRGSKRAVAAT